MSTRAVPNGSHLCDDSTLVRPPAGVTQHECEPARFHRPEVLQFPHPVSLPSQSRLAFKSDGRIFLVDTQAIIAIHAQGNYISLLCEATVHRVRTSISELARELGPYGFIRIHRSALVNACFVEEIWPLPTGEYELRLKSGKKYTVSRTYRRNLRLLAELWVGAPGFFDEKGNVADTRE